MICRHCNHKNDSNSKFCIYCGEPLDVENKSRGDKQSNYTNEKPKNKIFPKVIVALSCIVVLLGIFVILKFTVFVDNEKDSTASIQNSLSNTDDKDTVTSDNNVISEENKESSKPVSKLYVSNTDCSSILHDSTSINYGSSKAIDGDFSTVWSEGVSGFGQGEWIRLDLDSEYTIKKIKIVNGLVNNKNGYYNNNRPESLTLSFSDGSSQMIHLEDNNMGYQIVDITPVKSDYVKFTIDSVYYGSKYNDTCIGDIEILGY